MGHLLGRRGKGPTQITTTYCSPHCKSAKTIIKKEQLERVYATNREMRRKRRHKAKKEESEGRNQENPTPQDSDDIHLSPTIEGNE